MQTWTLTELATLATRALAGAGVQVASGRVTGMPDGRLIRWYTTIGLLDRPKIGPDRFARYGPRQLLQLVAVKRLQAQGLSIAQIQERLAGATDAQLRRVAALPSDLAQPQPKPADTGAQARVAKDAGGDPAGDPFWKRRPAAPDRAGEVDRTGETVTRLHGLHVGGLTLLLPAEPTPDDIAAITVAAQPLLALLTDRGLLPDNTTLTTMEGRTG